MILIVQMFVAPIVVFFACAISYRLLTGRSRVVFRSLAHGKYFTDLQEWKALFCLDLAEHLRDLQMDDDIYGFTLGIPEDIELHFMPGIARESALEGEQPNSEYWLSRRYYDNWEFLPHGKYYANSCEFLEQTLCKSQSAISLSNAAAQARLLNDFHYACLDAMSECNKKLAFGNIWFKMLYVSDSEFGVVKRSFYALNKGRALKEGAKVYPRFGVLTAPITNVLKTVRIRYARWKIGARR